jgi:hypothetical protein
MGALRLTDDGSSIGAAMGLRVDYCGQRPDERGSPDRGATGIITDDLARLAALVNVDRVRNGRAYPLDPRS